MDLKQFYGDRKAQFTVEANALLKRYEQLGWLRLLAFIGLIAVLILAWQYWPLCVAILLTGFGIAGFAWLVKWHGRIQHKGKHLQAVANENEKELAALENDFENFHEGNEFVDIGHPYAYDLDIFGPYSVFQMINRGSTSIGRKRLANWLSKPADKINIDKRQEAALEFAKKTDWQHHFRASGAMISEEIGQIKRLRYWIEEAPIVLNNRVRTAALWIAPLLFVIGLLMLIFVVPWYIAILFLLPAAMWLRKAQEEVERLHDQTGKVTKILSKYAELIQQIETADFQSKYLLNIQRQFSSGAYSASKAVGKLAYRLSQLDVRDNAFVVLLEFSVVWDLQQVYLLDKWKARHKEDLLKWFDALAEMEALISLGNLKFNHPNWVFPEITDEKQLKAESLGHPLLPKNQCVTNSTALPTKGHIHLITGSNMAGKSTWLRSIGVNIVLALAGSPVRGKHFSVPLVQVYTSMRTQDALHESTSGFFAELKRLKFIIDAVEDPSKTDGLPVFFILDEILKGTNSRDRHTGAKALIQQLIKSRGAGLIATHDLELAALEENAAGRIENWAMEVEVENGKLHFDYTLKRGVSQSFNATLLMQQMGIKIDQ